MYAMRLGHYVLRYHQDLVSFYQDSSEVDVEQHPELYQKCLHDKTLHRRYPNEDPNFAARKSLIYWVNAMDERAHAMDPVEKTLQDKGLAFITSYEG